MRRYKPSLLDEHYVGMQKDVCGPYVFYFDHEDAMREKDKQIAALTKKLEYLSLELSFAMEEKIAQEVLRGKEGT